MTLTVDRLTYIFNMTKYFLPFLLFICILYPVNASGKISIAEGVSKNISSIETINAGVFADWMDLVKKYVANIFKKQVTDSEGEGVVDMSDAELLHPTKTILILGDSLTEGYGIQKTEAFPWLVEQKLNREYPDCNVKIVNGGISGSTSAGALSRLQRHFEQMDQKPELVMIALGSNDGLRGLPLEAMEQNLQEAISWLLSQEVEVVLAGMQIPPNYGFMYSRNFKKVFPQLAKKNKLKLIPFLLEDVAMKAHLNLSDGIHPNAEGHKVIAQTVFPYFKFLCK